MAGARMRRRIGRLALAAAALAVAAAAAEGWLRLRGARPVQVNRAINLMRQMIDTDPHRRLSLRELAGASGVSGKHLCRSFQKSLGCSPVETYRLLRLQLAVALLSRSNLSVREIADRCGFEDPAYFSRCFSSVFGCAPSQVRERLRNGMLPPANPLPVDITPRLFW